MNKKPHNSPLSNTLLGAIAEALAGLLIDWGQWVLAFVMGITALAWFAFMGLVTAMWLVVAGLRDE